MLIWLAGVVLSLIHICIGRTGLHSMIKRSTPVNGEPFNLQMHKLCDRMDIRQKVQVRKSSQCLTPFTCYLFKPVILLPSNTCRWSENRLRVVLLHELAHIKRRDHITRFIARFICTLLWFVPPVWNVYNRMQIEEEKACDALVIGTGVNSFDYARHIIDIARSTKGKVLSLMPQNSFSKRSNIEPRIRNILKLRGTYKPTRLIVLIRILVICIICLLALHVVNPVSARDNGRLLRKETPVNLLYGRWLNEQDFNPWKADPAGKFMGKLIINPDGSMQLHQTPTCLELFYTGINGSYTITDSFTDRRGNHIYEVMVQDETCGNCILKELWRIDSTGTKMEITWDFSDYPSEIDPNKYEYYTFYRKQ